MYTKQDIAQAGKSLSNTLSAIGSQIITNRLNNSRAQVLKKYQNPSAILYSEGGQLRNAAEIQAIVGQDLMWLTSNGFEDDAKMLQGYIGAIEKSLSTAQSNTQYVNMVKNMTGMQIPTEGMDMTRADLPSMYGSIFGKIDPNAKNKVTEIDAGGKVYITTTDEKTGKEIHTYEKWKTPDWYRRETFSNVSGLPGPIGPNPFAVVSYDDDGQLIMADLRRGEVDVMEGIYGQKNSLQGVDRIIEEKTGGIKKSKTGKSTFNWGVPSFKKNPF